MSRIAWEYNPYITIRPSVKAAPSNQSLLATFCLLLAPTSVLLSLNDVLTTTLDSLSDDDALHQSVESAENGFTVFQIKFSREPARIDDVNKWILEKTAGEIQKIEKLIERGANTGQVISGRQSMPIGPSLTEVAVAPTDPPSEF